MKLIAFGALLFVERWARKIPHASVAILGLGRTDTGFLLLPLRS